MKLSFDWKKMKATIWVGIYIVTIIIMALVCQVSMGHKIAENELELKGDWDIVVNAQLNPVHNLDEFHYKNSRKGDVITLSRTIEETDFRDTALTVLVRYAKFHVYVDKELIYEKNNDAYARGDFLGKGYAWVSLPDDSVGKRLSLVFVLSEDENFHSFESIYYVEATEAANIVISDNILTIMIASVFFLAGIGAILASLFIRNSDKRFRMLIFIGFFSVFASIWLICNSLVASAFVEEYCVAGKLEYISMYLAFASMIFFVATLADTVFFRRLMYGLGIAMLCATILQTLLSQLNLLHFTKTVHTFQFVGILCISFMCVMLVKQTRKKDRRVERIVLEGVVAFMILAILELIRYRYNKLCLPIHQIRQSFIPLALAIFISFMFVAFSILILERVEENVEREKLYNMAYYDTLTGLRNRAWCDRIMRSFEKINRPVTIMYFDLDHFKDVNDTFGHRSGDDLLRDFARCLSGVFRGADCVGRMGGDEFIAILEYIPQDVVENKIKQLQEAVDEVNLLKEDGKIYFSVGYADNFTHPDINIWKVYEKSDHAMYMNKQERRNSKED